MTRPTWAEISRARLLSNYGYLRGLAAGRAELLAVVKADAYGHGLSHCAPLLAEAGAPWLGVTSVEEGVRTRMLCRDDGLGASMKPRILIMAGLWRGEAEAILEHRLTPVVWENYQLDLIESAARKMGLPAGSVRVHLEVDTGMSRQGIQAPVTVTDSIESNPASDAAARLALLLLRFHASSPLKLEGVMTHFSAPEDESSSATADQFRRLDAALELVRMAGLTPQWLHAGNSATLIDGRSIPRLHALAERIGAKLMLRPGLALYGYVPRFMPGETTQGMAAGAACKPVLSWKSRMISTRTIEAGEAVGYNSTFRASRTTPIALLPIGYADGLNRLLSNRGHVLVRGGIAAIVGRISMDQTVIDVTELPAAEIGDEVAILGCQTMDCQSSNGSSDLCITAYDHADLTGTIPWETLCAIAARVPRILVE